MPLDPRPGVFRPTSTPPAPSSLDPRPPKAFAQARLTRGTISPRSSWPVTCQRRDGNYSSRASAVHLLLLHETRCNAADARGPWRGASDVSGCQAEPHERECRLKSQPAKAVRSRLASCGGLGLQSPLAFDNEPADRIAFDVQGHAGAWCGLNETGGLAAAALPRFAMVESAVLRRPFTALVFLWARYPVKCRTPEGYQRLFEHTPLRSQNAQCHVMLK